MVNLRETAHEYAAPETKNIVELDQVDIDLDITDETFQDKDGKDFIISSIEVEGEKYRVPKSVVSQLKVQLAAKPEMKYFKVSKSGEGMSTKYTVIVL